MASDREKGIARFLRPKADPVIRGGQARTEDKGGGGWDAKHADLPPSINI